MLKLSGIFVAGVFAVSSLMSSGETDSNSSRQISEPVRYLTGLELSGLMDGSFEATIAGGKTSNFFANSDGTLTLSAVSKPGAGRWQVQGNNLCISWDAKQERDIRCGRVMTAGQWYYTTHSKSVKFRRII